MTDVPDRVRVSVVAPIGNNDHFSLLAVVSMAQAVPNLCVSRKVFLNHQVNWKTVCGAIQNLPWRNIRSADDHVEVLNEHLLLVVGRFEPRSSVCTIRKSHCLMINAGMLLASSRGLIFGGVVITLRLTGKSLSAAK